MPPISSTTANVVKNIFKEKGTREPSMARTPNEKAISVDIGIAAPLLYDVPEENKRNIHTGTIIPPMAAIIGSKTLMPYNDFTFNFQTDSEKENGHQGVVYE